jgi:hypothetical protein
MSYETELVFQNPRNRVPESSTRIWSQLTPQRSSRIMLHISLAAMNTHAHTLSLSLSSAACFPQDSLLCPSLSPNTFCAQNEEQQSSRKVFLLNKPQKQPQKKKNKKTDLRQHEVSCDNHDVRRTQWYYNPPPLIPEAAAEETTIKATTKDSDHFVE